MTEDLGLNELKANPPYPPLGKGANKGSFSKGAGAKRLRIFNQDILLPSAEILSANLMTNAQNDKIKSPLPPFKKGGKIPAFTLAEVLVTLGIIGIVAAMTLPMLAKNYQFYVRQQQFKKVYAALDVAIQKTQIDMGEGVKCFYLDYGWNTKNLVECDYFYQELAKNLQILKICEGNAYEKGCLPKEMRGFDEVYLETQGSKEEGLSPSLASGCSGFLKDKLETKVRVYMLNSGFTIIPYFVWSVGEGDVHGGGAPIFLVDINAHKGPNKWGHDIFIFQLNKPKTNDSVFSLVPGRGCHALDVGGVYTRDFVEYLYGRTTNY